MPEYKVLWSLRGRAVIEADNADAAEEAFYGGVERAEDDPLLPDNDGYEIDGIEEIVQKEEITNG